MSRGAERVVYPLLLACCVALGFAVGYAWGPTKTFTKIKNHTIICMVDNQQAIASCTRVKRK